LAKFYQEIDSVTLANNTSKVLNLTVPSGKIWIIHQIMMHNGDDVQRNCRVRITDSSGNNLAELGAQSLGAGVVQYNMVGTPRNVADNYPGCVRKVKGGNKISLQWDAGGASSGGTANYCISYEEVVE